jgi:hypothetical protein
MGNQISNNQISNNFLNDYANIIADCVIRIQKDNGMVFDNEKEEKQRAEIKQLFFKFIENNYKNYYEKIIKQNNKELLKKFLYETSERFFNYISKYISLSTNNYYLFIEKNGRIILRPPEEITDQYDKEGKNWMNIYTMGNTTPEFLAKISNKGGKKSKRRRIRTKSTFSTFKKSYAKRRAKQRVKRRTIRKTK